MRACVYLRMRAAERVGFWGSLVMIGVSWRCADLGGIFHHRSTGPRGARFPLVYYLCLPINRLSHPMLTLLLL